MLVIVKQNLVHIGRIDGPTEYVSRTLAAIGSAPQKGQPRQSEEGVTCHFCGFLLESQGQKLALNVLSIIQTVRQLVSQSVRQSVSQSVIPTVSQSPACLPFCINHKRPYVVVSQARSWSPWLVLGAISWAFIAKS